MAKDSFYFPHDFNSRNDPKLRAVRRKYGSAGIGIYWQIIEMLYEQEGYLMLASMDDIAWETDDDVSIVSSIVNDFKLFYNDGERFWSESALNRLKLREEKRERRANAGRKGGLKKAENQSDSSNAKAMPEQCQVNDVAIPSKERKVKESKGKEIKEKREYAPAVLLTEEEFGKLNIAHGSYPAMQMIGKLSASKQANGKKYKSDYHAILNWVVDWWNEHGKKQAPAHINPQTGAKQVVI